MGASRRRLASEVGLRAAASGGPGAGSACGGMTPAAAIAEQPTPCGGAVVVYSGFSESEGKGREGLTETREHQSKYYL